MPLMEGLEEMFCRLKLFMKFGYAKRLLQPFPCLHTSVVPIVVVHMDQMIVQFWRGVTIASELLWIFDAVVSVRETLPAGPASSKPEHQAYTTWAPRRRARNSPDLIRNETIRTASTGTTSVASIHMGMAM